MNGIVALLVMIISNFNVRVFMKPRVSFLFYMLIVSLHTGLLFASDNKKNNGVSENQLLGDLYAHQAVSGQLKRDGRLHGGNSIGSSCQFSWLGNDGDNPSPEDYLKVQREEKARKEQVERNRKIRADRSRAELGRSSPSQNHNNASGGNGFCAVS